MKQWTSVLRQTCRIATCHGFQRPFYRAHSALRGAAAGTVERPYHHSVVFGKSGKHRANTLAAPVGFRDGHPVPMQNISSPIKTKKQMVIETFWISTYLIVIRLQPETQRRNKSALFKP